MKTDTIEALVVTVVGGILVFWLLSNLKTSGTTDETVKNYSGYSYAPYKYTGPDVYGSTVADSAPAGAGLQSLFSQTVGTQWIGPGVLFDLMFDPIKNVLAGKV